MSNIKQTLGISLLFRDFSVGICSQKYSISMAFTGLKMTAEVQIPVEKYRSILKGETQCLNLNVSKPCVFGDWTQQHIICEEHECSWIFINCLEIIRWKSMFLKITNGLSLWQWEPDAVTEPGHPFALKSMGSWFMSITDPTIRCSGELLT